MADEAAVLTVTKHELAPIPDPDHEPQATSRSSGLSLGELIVQRHALDVARLGHHHNGSVVRDKILFVQFTFGREEDELEGQDPSVFY